MKAIFISLGCDKNTVDSEKIYKRFIERFGFDVAIEPKDADIVIINTCSFIHDAKKESIDYIKYFVDLKKKNQIKKILVVGCLVAENNKTHEFDDVFKDVDVSLSVGKYLDDLNDINDRMLDVLSFSSSIKICDGCDKYCSYCAIPYLRGHFRSATKENILKEVKVLAKNGTKELSIVGQDILHYGYDFKKKNAIIDLINEISKIDGIEWIRLLYCYPEEINDDIIYLMENNNKVLPYIDMPIQHASNKILKLMNRHTSKSDIKEIVYKLRVAIPNICIRTTLIVGFPGETEEDFDELSEFVKEMKFDKLGVFAYSREKLSKSYNFKNQVDEKIKISRKKKILDIQKEIVKAKNQNRIGDVYYSIVEGKDTSKQDTYIVRPYFDARDIDDKVYVKSKELLISGSFVNVEIKKVLGYDLEGEIL